MKWVVVATIVALVVLLLVRFLRGRLLGQATIHMANMKSEAEALEVARILNGLQGIMEVRVDLERRAARVTYRKTKIAIEEIMRAFDDLVRAGKIQYAGLSNFPAWRAARGATLAELHGWAPVAAVQFEYSLAERSAPYAAFVTKLDKEGADFAGVVADRIDNRKLVIGTQSISMFFSAVLALLVLTGSETLPLVYALAVLSSTALVFDAPGPTFRHEAYEAYKATRQKMPEDLIVQVPYIKDLVRLHGIPQLELQGYEADDLIGTLARQATQQDMDVVVVSNDKDLMQLVTPRVTFYDAAKDRSFDPAGVTAHLGVHPAQIPDLLGLQGDAVDNIPGVKGIGTKTALALLQVFPSLEALYDNLARLETLPLRNVKTLRQKLEADPSNPTLIVTSTGVGYMLVCPD